MADKKMITIPVEEYKSLLIKETPSDREKIILESIIDIIKDHSKIVDSESYRADFKGLEFHHETDCLKEILTTVYTVDRNRFIEMYKDLASDKKQKTIQEINMEYVRRIKELKAEAEE